MEETRGLQKAIDILRLAESNTEIEFDCELDEIKLRNLRKELDKPISERGLILLIAGNTEFEVIPTSYCFKGTGKKSKIKGYVLLTK